MERNAVKVTKSCLHCEREFFWDDRIPGSQKLYCSRRCKEAAHVSRALFRQRRERNRHCQHCNVDINWRVGQAKFCSVDCRQAFEKRAQLAKHEGRRCLHCDADISAFSLHSKYCSQKCGRLHRNPHKRKWRTHCVICKRKLKGKWGGDGGQVCSEKCKAKRSRQIETPEQKQKNRDRNQRRYWKEQVSNLAVKRIVTGDAYVAPETPRYVTLNRPPSIENKRPRFPIEKQRSTCTICGAPITDPARRSYCCAEHASIGDKQHKAKRSRRHYQERKQAHFLNRLILGSIVDD